MNETGSPKVLFENLDVTPIHSILWTGLHRHSPGRPVEYNPEWDLRALIPRQLLYIPQLGPLADPHRPPPEPLARPAMRWGRASTFSYPEETAPATGFQRMLEKGKASFQLASGYHLERAACRCCALHGSDDTLFPWLRGACQTTNYGLGAFIESRAFNRLRASSAVL